MYVYVIHTYIIYHNSNQTNGCQIRAEKKSMVRVNVAVRDCREERVKESYMILF